MKHLLHIHDRSMRLIETVEISGKAAQSLKANPARITVFRAAAWPQDGNRWSVLLSEPGKPDRLAKGIQNRTAWQRRNARNIANRYKNHPRITARIVKAKP